MTTRHTLRATLITNKCKDDLRVYVCMTQGIPKQKVVPILRGKELLLTSENNFRVTFDKVPGVFHVDKCFLLAVTDDGRGTRCDQRPSGEGTIQPSEVTRHILSLDNFYNILHAARGGGVRVGSENNNDTPNMGRTVVRVPASDEDIQRAFRSQVALHNLGNFVTTTGISDPNICRDLEEVRLDDEIETEFNKRVILHRFKKSFASVRDAEERSKYNTYLDYKWRYQKAGYYTARQEEHNCKCFPDWKCFKMRLFLPSICLLVALCCLVAQIVLFVKSADEATYVLNDRVCMGAFAGMFTMAFGAIINLAFVKDYSYEKNRNWIEAGVGCSRVKILKIIPRILCGCLPGALSVYLGFVVANDISGEKPGRVVQQSRGVVILSGFASAMIDTSLWFAGFLIAEILISSFRCFCTMNCFCGNQKVAYINLGKNFLICIPFSAIGGVIAGAISIFQAQLDTSDNAFDEIETALLAQIPFVLRAFTNFSCQTLKCVSPMLIDKCTKCGIADLDFPEYSSVDVDIDHFENNGDVERVGKFLTFYNEGLCYSRMVVDFEVGGNSYSVIVGNDETVILPENASNVRSRFEILKCACFRVSNICSAEQRQCELICCWRTSKQPAPNSRKNGGCGSSKCCFSGPKLDHVVSPAERRSFFLKGCLCFEAVRDIRNEEDVVVIVQ